jgi:voltage-gated potassium channel
MKGLVSGVAAYVGKRGGKRNTRLLFKFMFILLAIITVYAVAFHWLMEIEGQQHSWITGFYWTLTVMSTLGFGDITFSSDLGRVFSIVVMISGVIFLLVLMPFTLDRVLLCSVDGTPEQRKDSHTGA